ELVAIVRRLGDARGKEVLGRYRFIPVEPQRRTVNVVRAGLGDDCCRDRAFILRLLAVGVHLELADGVYGRQGGEAVAIRICASAVAHVVVRSAVDTELDTTPIGAARHARVGGAIAG